MTRSSCDTCGGTGTLRCLAHVAGDGCDELQLVCPDCAGLTDHPRRATLQSTPGGVSVSTIKVGDMVTTRTGAGYEVVGIHGVQAWLRQPDYYITQPLDRLTKVEPKWEVGKTYRYRSGPKGTECTMLWVGGTYHEAIGVRAVNLGDEVTTTDQLVAFSPRDRYWYEEV